MNKNHNFTPQIVTVRDFTVDAQGIAATDSGTVFIPGCVPGDTVKVISIKKHKNYISAEKFDIVSPSPDRIKPDCPVFGECGGCSFRSITYASELNFKQKTVGNALRRIGKITAEIRPIVGAENPLRYRNKAQLPVSRDKKGTFAGFYSRGSHSAVRCTSDCLLQPEIFSHIEKLMCMFMDEKNIPCYSEKTSSGLVRHIFLRCTSDGRIMVCIVINGDKMPFEEELVKLLTCKFPSIESIILNINKKSTNVILGDKMRNIYGRGFIEDTLCSLKFRISPNSFYQVNHDQAERLYKKAAEYANPEGKNLIDMYCGVGTVGLSMADKAKSIIGVEIVEKAVKDAAENAKLNGINNARFICGDASLAAEKLSGEGIKADVVILDPPRKGCDGALIPVLCKRIKPERIVYISCNPATLARDCAEFEKNGYIFKEATPFDLFPRTGHVETVALLESEKAACDNPAEKREE